MGIEQHPIERPNRCDCFGQEAYAGATVLRSRTEKKHELACWFQGVRATKLGLWVWLGADQTNDKLLAMRR